MSRSGRSVVARVSLAVVLSLAAVACGGSADPTGTGSGLSGTLRGSGATFPKAFYEVSIAAFEEEEPGLTIEYAGGGSGTGRQNLQDGVVDFAGSDGLIKDGDRPLYRGEVLYVPTVAAPITVSYNLRDVDDLVLDADTIARMFQRRITKWDDPAIKALNGSVTLPARDIVVAHRSDGSGTTENFTKYLAAAAPDTWALGSGSTVEWPADAQAGNGNAGVAAIVKENQGAVGYVDFSDAKATGLRFATIVNKAGRPVKASVEGATSALANTTINPDLSYNPLNADGAGAYPITAPTWVLVYKDQPDRAKGEALKGFLTYMLTDGQGYAPPLDYARLPDELRQKALAQLDNIVLPAT